MNTDRFKFRAWDKRKKRYDERYAIGADGWAYQLVDVDNDWYDLIPNEEVIIEQCTGLLDKNGKLIYEGDIIRFDQKLFEDESYKVVWDKRQEKFTCIGIASHSEYITWYTRFENMQSNVCEVVNNVNAWERYR